MTTPVLGPSPTSGGTAPTLTRRELDVLTRVAHGVSYPDMAAEWFIAEVTVRGYALRATRKLGASSMAHAVFLACQVGVLDSQPPRHGELAGYSRHRRRGEKPCDACREANSAYAAARKAARVNAA